MAKIKVFALATDGDDDGTSAAIYTDEKQMYLDLAEKMGDDDEQEEAKRLADANDLEGLKDFVSEIDAPFMFTWATDEQEIEIPAA